jgi:excinuclease UvrABC nuclease subunit
MNSSLKYFGIDFIEYDLKNNEPYFCFGRDNIKTVYVLLNNNRAIYVGQTIYIRDRLMSHRLTKDIDKVYISKINNFKKYDDYNKLFKHYKIIDILERNLIRNFNPKYNIQHKKTITN